MSLLLPDLEAFIYVVKNKSVHEASKKLNLTQTAVTQRIRNLEKKLGTSLFVRSRKGMSPTNEGLILAKYCEKFKGLEGELLHQVKGSTNSINVRVCITASSSIIKARVIPNIYGLMKKYSNINFSFNVVDNGAEITYLKSGHSQFAILPQDQVVNELDSKIIKPVQNILVANSLWKNRKLEDILINEKLIDFYQDEEATLNYFKKYNLFNYYKKNGHFINNTDALLSLLINGLGYSVLPKAYIEDKLENKLLVNLNDNKYYEQKLALVWHPRQEMPKYFKDIIKAIK